MATYKVIQDIEAEDKLVGPLSLRQSIYAAIAAICAYLSFLALTKGVSFLLVVLMPPALFTGFFAFPWGRDQPTEVWALAKIRFFLKPRRRIWNQSGVKNLVNVTAPKRVDKIRTDNLTQTEVKSRLAALANTLDSRGWAVKNVNANLSSAAYGPVISPSDRLIDPSAMPQQVSTIEVTPGYDIFDTTNNQRALELDQLMTSSSQTRRQQLLDRLRQSMSPKPSPQPVTTARVATPAPGPQLPPPADYWFLPPPTNLPSTSASTKPSLQVQVAAYDNSRSEPATDEAVLTERLKRQREKIQHVMSDHLKVIQPLDSQVPTGSTPQPQSEHPAMTPRPDPATMRLARNDDLSIATIARMVKEEHPNEVVVSLHKHTA